MVVAEAVVLLPLVGLLVRRRGYNATKEWLGRHSVPGPAGTTPHHGRPVAEAVALVAGRRITETRCLVRSLVVWFLVRRRGEQAEVVIGAPLLDSGRLSAHAWVEVAQVPITDPADVRERFPVLAPRSDL